MGIDTLINRAVFLDRDGVLNRALVREGKPFAPTSFEEFEILPGVVDVLDQFKAAGFICVVVTNQPDVARGRVARETVEAMNQELRRSLPLDDILVCYHDDDDECPCRKPKPGLLVKAARIWNISLPESFMVGDRSKDIEAGRRAGCRTILIDYGYTEGSGSSPDHSAASLMEARSWILASGKGISNWGE